MHPEQLPDELLYCLIQVVWPPMVKWMHLLVHHLRAMFMVNHLLWVYLIQAFCYGVFATGQG